ncbi:MAG: peptide-methionine (S)-S-oxide reductase [Armatimonadetes bacterium]|nr:peptide-methionine (S)-S-oxide reductase [Armatimonadota bacterium]
MRAQRNQITETATFGAGCFLGVEAAFRAVAGVQNTSVG